MSTQGVESMVVIPERVVRMLFIEGYFKEFWHLVQEGSTQTEAYERIEQELTKYNLPGRYTSYESFKYSKHYYYNRSTPIKFF